MFKTVTSAVAAANNKTNGTPDFSQDQKDQLLAIGQSLGIPRDQALRDINDPQMHDELVGVLQDAEADKDTAYDEDDLSALLGPLYADA